MRRSNSSRAFSRIRWVSWNRVIQGSKFPSSALMPLAHSGEQRGQFVIVSDAPVRLQIQQAHGRQWVGEFTPRGDDAEVDYPRAAGRHEAGFEPFPPPRAIPSIFSSKNEPGEQESDMRASFI